MVEAEFQLVCVGGGLFGVPGVECCRPSASGPPGKLGLLGLAWGRSLVLTGSWSSGH